MDIKERLKNLSPEQRALLLKRLAEQRIKEEGSKPSGIPKRNSNENLPLSVVQQRFWFLQKLEPDSPAYNIVAAIELIGNINVDALEKSLNKIIERHEVLRSVFPSVDGTPIQFINDYIFHKIEEETLQASDEQEFREKVKQIAAANSHQVFDLENGPLINFRLYSYNENLCILVIYTHHLVADGYSIRILMKELGMLYDAYSNMREVKLPDLPIQYADFSIWQQNHTASEEMKEHLNYWVNRLKGAQFVLEMPADFLRPPMETFHGSIETLEFPEALTSKLRSFALKENVSVYMVLLAAFQTLLYRYTAQEDIITGTAAVNVSKSEIENLIGSFSNNILFRTDFSGDPEFRLVLHKVKETVLEAQEHQDLPFEKLLEAIQPERDLSRNPLFQIAFIFHQGSLEQHLHIGDLMAKRLPVDMGTSRFDITLELEDDKKKISGFIEYKSEIYKVETIKRLCGHLFTLIDSILNNPDAKVSNFKMLTDAERPLLVDEWNKTDVDYPPHKYIHNLFEEQGEIYPDRIAAEFEGEKISYKQLNAKANKLAHYLKKYGVGKDKLVGLCVNTSLDMMVSLLGILKAGGAYVPIDPFFPQDRIAYMLEDSEASVLITHTNLLDIFPAYDKKIICIDADWDAIEKESDQNPTNEIDTLNLAYVIYTSGSTGKPKGVQIPHRPVVNFLLSMLKEPGLTKDDRLLSVTTLSFDIAVLELFLPIIVGARVIIVPKEVTFDGKLLLDRLVKRKVTAMQATPSTWRLLIEAGWNDQVKLKMMCGGEALPRDLANQLIERGGELWNMYGPTETTIWSAVSKITNTSGPVVIGPPIANTQFYILDKNLQPVPIGVPGELHIGGEGLARGYFKKPELTKEKFINNPFRNVSDARMYKTGDLARFLTVGSIEFLGRLDFQVKVRGFRIELGEIENIISTHTNVKQVVVTARQISGGDSRLVAYIIPEPGTDLTASDLREHIKEKLPDYMIPSFFVFLENFPLTPNGKIDRKALPDPDTASIEPETDYIEARDELEIQLTAVWKKILGLKKIGVKDNFFEIGGHSLLAAKLFAHIEKSLGKNLPLATLFQAPTIEGLAAILRQDNWKPSWSSLVPIKPQGSKPPLFLIHGAEGNVLLYRELAHHLSPDQPVYGLQSEGLDGSKELQTRFEIMASNYIKEIKSVQPEGPYLLGGYCLGGTIAFEIAQQLKANNEEVALLAMFETYNIQEIPDDFPKYLRLYHKMQNILFHIENLLSSKSEGRIKFFKEKFNTELSRLKVSIDVSISKIKKKMNIGNGLTYHHLKIDEINDKAQAEYTPLVFDGDITLFKPKKNFAGLLDIYYGWGKYAGKGVKLKNITVSPRGMMVEPYVNTLAAQLQDEIDRALSNGKEKEVLVKETG